MRDITDRIRRGTSREMILQIARDEIGNFIGASQSTVWMGTSSKLKTEIEKRSTQAADQAAD